MWDYTNKKSSKGVNYTRYIASWMKIADKYGISQDEDLMEEWLTWLGLEESEVQTIREMAYEGKLELEINCERFIRSKNLEKIY